ncbi:uncharacterized protein [Narcine bancroftii]|uniref:uncharacterized protein n=1 Tax=Narcine bancroftii TaxID=1343680 RepID=UPI003831C5AF
MFPRRPRRPRETCCWREKEMKNLLEDPMGLAEQFDQFLGPNTYTWEEMHAIMGTLFSPQERQMIRQAVLLMWEREQPGDPRPHEQKYPLNEPRWDKRTPEGLTNMRHYREWTIKGIREAVPKGHNFTKAFGNHQGKDESPTDFLERVRKNVQQYAGVDPSTPMGEQLIRIEFVSKSWQDIRKKLEKEEDWNEKPLSDLLKKAQRVYVRREEEGQKRATKIMVQTIWQVNAGSREERRQNPPFKQPKKSKRVETQETR